MTTTLKTASIGVVEWRAKATKLFGDDPLQWKFRCPACGHVAPVQAWKDAGAPEGSAAFSCVGRWSSEAREAFGEGPGPCNYAGGGLIGLNPVCVIDDDGNERHVFQFAEVEKKP